MAAMKAIRYYRHGSPSVLRLEDADMPAAGDRDVLIRVHAASVNPLDWHFMRGTPYIARIQLGLWRPRNTGLGVDLAGTVEAAGAHVTGFAPGDEVFGEAAGALAEYVVISQNAAVAAKPTNLTFEQAAAVPVAAFTALQALRDHGQLQPGQKVLVNGAAGGVGTFTVQIAKALGAEVTGVCSTANLDLVSSIGADHVIDYTRQDFTASKQRYDLLIDIAGSRPVSASVKTLTSRGTMVCVGAPNKGNWLGPVSRPVKMTLLKPFTRQAMRFFIARPNRDDLEFVRGLLEAGQVVPVIDRTYPLHETAQAIAYLEQGHARGKVIVTI
jgi:NADPH:quinone reductase-like Zn-dependent oxidoreductase